MKQAFNQIIDALGWTLLGLLIYYFLGGDVGNVFHHRLGVVGYCAILLVCFIGTFIREKRNVNP